MSRNEGRFQAAEGTPTPEDEGTSAVPASEAVPNTPFSWTVPTEFIELPSAGKFYPPGHPLQGQETLELRYMTAKEEDILTDRSLLKKGVAIDRALQNLIVDSRVKVNDLLMGDKNALLVAARVTGYGAEYVTNVTCPSCQNVDEHQFDLQNLSFVDVETAMVEHDVHLTDRNTFVLTLPVSKAQIECRMLTGQDETAIAKIATRSAKSNNGPGLLTTQLGKTIVSINGDPNPVQIGILATTMPARDSRYVRKVLASVVPNIDMTQEYSCTNCDYTADLEVPLTADFFWPK